MEENQGVKTVEEEVVRLRSMKEEKVEWKVEWQRRRKNIGRTDE